MKSGFLFAAFALLLGLSAPAVAQYDAIYVFGDSYCDVGNIYLATNGAEPAAPYYKGRFSNGPLWVDHLAASLKLPLKPSLAGGTDYAFGGAQLLQAVPTPGGPIPSVAEQVGLYLAAHGGKADPKALYVIEGGGNDILDATGGNPQALGFQIGFGLADLAAVLSAAGAKSFLIPNLFNVGLLPAGRSNFSFDTAAIQEADKELAAQLAMQAPSGAAVYSPDIYSLAQSIENDLSHYGFTNVTNPCIQTATGRVCPDPAHTLFWDTEHLSEFGQADLAVAAETALHP